MEEYWIMEEEFLVSPCGGQYFGGGIEQYTGANQLLIEQYYDITADLNKKSAMFFSGLYFDPREKGSGYTRAKLPCVICPNREDNTVHCREIEAIPKREKNTWKGSARKDVEPIHISTRIENAPGEHKGTEDPNFCNISFTQYGRFMYPIGGGLGLVWISPFQIQNQEKKEGGDEESNGQPSSDGSKGLKFPGGPYESQWNVFRLIQSKDKKGEPFDFKSSFYIQVTIGEKAKVQYLTIPDAAGPKGLMFTDKPKTKFRLGFRSGHQLIHDKFM